MIGTGMRRLGGGGVALQLILISGLMLLVVSTSFLFAYQEGDRAAADRQTETVTNSIRQQGKGLERELKLETIWADAYSNAAVAPNPSWLDQYYGQYLSRLLGYDEIYVLDGSDQPIYGFEDGRQADVTAFEKDRADITDLIAAVRAPAVASRVTESDVDLGDGLVLKHRSISDVRRVGGSPTNVTVETILPDSSPAHGWRPSGPAPLLVATRDLDVSTLAALGKDLHLDDLGWLSPDAKAGVNDISTKVVDANGNPVGRLAWRKDLPGQQLLTRMSTALGIGFVLLLILGVLAARAIRRSMREARERVRNAAREARTDFLTGLPNRLALSEEAGGRIGALRPDEFLAVMAVDITGLRRINDHFGHGAGDKALSAVGQRLAETVPSGFVSRMGGDEFAILVNGAELGSFARIAEEITGALGSPLHLTGIGEVQIGASVGYAVAPTHGVDEDELFRRADLALSRARREGAGTARRFEASLEAEGVRRLAVEAGLRRAIARDAIGVAYQPLIDANTGTIVGVEALARWTDPELGLVSPGEFIAVAEETGLIVDIGEQVFRKTLADARAWPTLTVSVNVSAVQIQRTDVPEMVRRLLAEADFPASRLEIELTESSLVGDEARANAQMTAVQKLGVKVALDDFGTGYASLLYLRQFGFDKLKIDQRFVRDSDSSVEARAMVISITTMCKTLGLQVTAEGVENADQARFLSVAGVDRLQGYHFARPIPAPELSRLVETWRAAA